MSSNPAMHSPQPVIAPAAPNWTFTWWVAIALLHPLMRLALRLRIEGRENLRRSGAQIIASNHTSQIDPVIVGYASGLETSFLAKEEVFRASPALAWLIRTYHAYPVNRGAGDVGALRRCSELLGSNRSVVLFPEGTRSKSGTLQALRPGVAMLSIMNRVPIVPAFVSGVRQSVVPWIVDPDIIKYNRRMNEPAARPKFRLSSLGHRVKVVFGKPIYPDGFQRNKEDYVKLTAQLRGVMLEMEAREAARRQ
jgi:1-acyl-sn-glycerol-3-phosphate acyltransferase